MLRDQSGVKCLLKEMQFEFLLSPTHSFLSKDH
ncbi:hypothetical protein F383_22220 [Gossypium arboreum]|uniref:Uncharacterized protein n=1 Tax=Gossypium arboreum TaxID=29729 RepID=A0A0B0MPY6_GOSAR|nr:hypothetical protein F383_22220 [Gossypium arboreum]